MDGGGSQQAAGGRGLGQHCRCVLRRPGQRAHLSWQGARTRQLRGDSWGRARTGAGGQAEPEPGPGDLCDCPVHLASPRYVQQLTEEGKDPLLPLWDIYERPLVFASDTLLRPRGMQPGSSDRSPFHSVPFGSTHEGASSPSWGVGPVSGGACYEDRGSDRGSRMDRLPWLGAGDIREGHALRGQPLEPRGAWGESCPQRL